MSILLKSISNKTILTKTWAYSYRTKTLFMSSVQFEIQNKRWTETTQNFSHYRYEKDFINKKSMSFTLHCAYYRGVARGEAEGARAPLEFSRSVNPIQTGRGGGLCPSHYCQPRRIQKAIDILHLWPNYKNSFSEIFLTVFACATIRVICLFDRLSKPSFFASTRIGLLIAWCSTFCITIIAP